MTSQWLICIIGAYLIGSIPFGVIIGRARGIDVRDHGSKNIGATNVTRVLGKKLGVLCFLLDVSKGAGPIIVAGIMNGVVGRNVSELAQTEKSMPLLSAIRRRPGSERAADGCSWGGMRRGAVESWPTSSCSRKAALGFPPLRRGSGDSVQSRNRCGSCRDCGSTLKRRNP